MQFEVLATKRSGRRVQEQVDALPLDEAPYESEPSWRSGLRPRALGTPEHAKIDAIFDQFDDLARYASRQGLARSLVGHEQNGCLAFSGQNSIERVRRDSADLHQPSLKQPLRLEECRRIVHTAVHRANYDRRANPAH